MSFPRYPQYKDSGVDWLGPVPAHWEVKPFKREIDRNDGGVWGDDPDGEGDTIVLRSTEQTVDGRWQISEPATRKLSDDERSASLLVEGDLLLTKSSGSSLHIGKTTLVTPEIASMACCYSNFMQRIRTKSSLLPKLAWYVMNNDLARRQFDLLSNSTTGLANLNGTMVGQILVPVPPLPEQREIAGFLDRETGKIDALVAEQERLLELLKEKRQAVISHAVTKGLNPNAPLKPSGLDWLGDIPAHWNVRKLSHFFRASKGKNGQMLTKEFCGANPGEYPVYSGQTENSGVMGTWDQFEFDAGEEGVLFSTTVGSGKVMSLRHLFGRFSLSQNCMIIASSSPQCSVRFFFHHFQPLFDYERNLIPQHMQASFRMEDLYSYRIALPPLAEQRAIVAHLDAATAQFDALTAAVERALALLQERRTALISAAVTGQIDVRDAT